MNKIESQKMSYLKEHLRSILTLVLVLIYTQTKLFSIDPNLHNKNPNTYIEIEDLIDYYNSIDNATDVKIDYNVYGTTYGYMLLVKSKNKTRKISTKKHQDLYSVFRSMGLDQQLKDVFKHEVLIETDLGQIWFPIQEQLLQYWKDELSNSDQALIYIRAFGSTPEKNETKWLFTINSFSSNYYDQLWEEALISFESENDDNGLRCLNKMISLSPEDGRNYAMMGYHYYMQGFPDKIPLLTKADSLYEISQNLTPDYGYQYYQRALVKFRLGEFTEAWENIEMAQKLDVPSEEFYQPFMQSLEKALPYKKYKSIDK